jgi:hypothetical protein
MGKLYLLRIKKKDQEGGMEGAVTAIGGFGVGANIRRQQKSFFQFIPIPFTALKSSQ